MTYVGTSIHFRRKETLAKVRRAAKKARISVSAFITQAAEKAAEWALAEDIVSKPRKKSRRKS